MNGLTQALAEACRQHLLAEKWLLAPSIRVGQQWLEAVAFSGQPVANAHVKTLKSLALTLAGPEMAKYGASLASPRGGALLVDRILHQLRGGRLRYLAQLQPSVRLAHKIHGSIDALRLAGLEIDQIDPRHFELRTKGIDLVRVMREYLQGLEADRTVDYAAVLRMARSRVEEDEALFSAGLRLLVPHLGDCYALERELLEAFPAVRVHSLPVDEPATATTLPMEIRTGADLLRWLPVPGQAPPPPPDATVTIYQAVGEVNEVREVLRRCLAESIPFDQVELLHTDRQTYVPLIYESLAALLPEETADIDELPATFAEGIPCRYSRPGRALLGWLAWARADYPQAGLVKMLRQGLLFIHQTESTETGFARLSALFRGVGIGFGRDRYLTKLREQIQGLERQAKSLPAADEDGESHMRRLQAAQSRLRDLRALRDLVERLLRLTPDASADAGDMLDAAHAFLERMARHVDQLDNYARLRLQHEVADMKRCLERGAGRGSLDVWSWLESLPGEATVLGSGPRESCLHVAHLLSGGHSGRPYTFIIGVDDGRFPAAGLQDPLLLDSERERMSRNLPTATSRLEDQTQGLTRTLAGLRGSITLGFSCRNLQDDRDLFPSPVVLSIYRIVSGRHDGDQTDLQDWLRARLISFGPQRANECLNEAEWWLWRLCGERTVDQALALVSERFPHLRRGWEATRQRKSEEFTVYDGLVQAAATELDPTREGGPILSSGSLQLIGRCPLAYFLRHGLGVESPPELTLDPGRWLDPLAFGQLLHEVFENSLRELVEQGQLPSYERHGPRMQVLLEQSVARYRDLFPPPSESVFRSQYRQLKQTVQVFLREEEHFCTRHQCRPVYLEVSLGMPAVGHCSALDCEEPVPVPLADGRSIRVRGRVDRIDQVGEGAQRAYRIVDYKTGSHTHYLRHDTFRQGRVIQPVVYLTMVRHRLREVCGADDVRVHHFSFFFPGPRAHGMRIGWDQDRLAQGHEILALLCQVVQRGAFLATTDHKDCHHCDYERVCGDVVEVAAGSQRKLANPANTLLQPFLELRGNGQA
jgi:ATP-dependent helicase/nuclease subunit B